ncbi:GerAB/ArcD/ProY family transporter [Paenibacillus macerans]|uniref:GerAB/ArcD/ProY family transporter n=1 Tax=Paenibacillus macerans TaxID=44252 RepID=UPI003D31B171
MDKSLQVVTVHILTHIGLIFFIFPINIIDSTTVVHWLPILIGFMVHIAIIAFFTKGLSYFENQGLLDLYLESGKILTVILVTPLFIYLLSTNMLTVRAYAETISLVFLSNTPLWAIITLTLFISTYIAALGIQALFRTGVLMACIFFPLVIFVLSMSFQNADWHYIYPIWEPEFSFLTDHNYVESFFAFIGGYMYLGFIQPQIRFKRSKLLWGSLALLPLYLLSVYVPVLTFGEDTASQFHFPFIVAVDTIDITWLMFDRITMFFLLSTVTFVMIFTALVLWIKVEIVKRCLPKSIKTPYIAAGLAILIFIGAISIPDWKDVDILFWWNSLLRFYVYITIPISTFILGKIAQRKAAASR